MVSCQDAVAPSTTGHSRIDLSTTVGFQLPRGGEPGEQRRVSGEFVGCPCHEAFVVEFGGVPAGVGEVEAVTAQQVGVRVVGWVRGWDPCPVGVAEFRAGGDELVDDARSWAPSGPATAAR